MLINVIQYIYSNIIIVAVLNRTRKEKVYFMAEFRISDKVKGITLILCDKTKKTVAYIENESLHYFLTTSNSQRQNIRKYLDENSIPYKTKNKEN